MHILLDLATLYIENYIEILPLPRETVAIIQNSVKLGLEYYLKIVVDSALVLKLYNVLVNTAELFVVYVSGKLNHLLT